MTRLNSMLVRAALWAQTKRNEEGQGLAEYGLILALVAIVCIVALTALGTNVADALQQVADAI